MDVEEVKTIVVRMERWEAHLLLDLLQEGPSEVASRELQEDQQDMRKRMNRSLREALGS